MDIIWNSLIYAIATGAGVTVIYKCFEKPLQKCKCDDVRTTNINQGKITRKCQQCGKEYKEVWSEHIDIIG